jgi:hypothetical protein
MRNRFALAFNGALVAAMFLIAFAVINKLPGGGQVAIHWGPDTLPDAWLGGSAIQLVNPIIALVIFFSASMLPQAFSPQKRSTGTVQSLVSNILLVQLVVQLSIAIYLL